MLGKGTLNLTQSSAASGEKTNPEPSPELLEKVFNKIEPTPEVP
jgi:hypothetical protein